MYKILAIDGGGIRGIIPAVVLDHIEQKAGQPISEMFDLIAGTSIGGIIAAMLTAPNSGGQPNYSADQVVCLLRKRGQEMFSRPRLLGRISEERYDHEPLDKILKEYFCDIMLAECVSPIIVPAYELERREEWFFKTRKAKCSDGYNYLLRDVCRATSAAPSYFEPAGIESMEGSVNHFIDGGVGAVSPAMCACAEALHLGTKVDSIVILSVGTGCAHNDGIPHKEAQSWGLWGWMKVITSILLDAGSDTANYQVKQLIDESNYLRLNTHLGGASDDLDNASDENIQLLEKRGGAIIKDKGKKIKSMIEILQAS